MRAPTLAQWVGEPETFLSEYWRRRPGVFRPEGGAYSSFSLADADAALASGFLREPYLEMTRAEQPLTREAYTAVRRIYHAKFGGFADLAKVGALLDDGATLLLRRIDHWHRATRDMLQELATELGLPVEAFYFVTPEGHQGLPLHRDDADVLVIQVAGSKSWHVHEGPADGNWDLGKVRGDEPAEIFRTTLRAGEVLYIPRAFAHRATGDGGLSAHLSLTIREAGTEHLESSLLDFAVQGVELPPRPLGDEALDKTAAELLDHALARLADLTPGGLLELARRNLVAQMPQAQPSLSLAAVAAAWEQRQEAEHDGTPAAAEPAAR
ncbi:JmjC domain-containing protein [Streptomyces sp. NBC_01190]|uniref:JmjC domain-containing protein n=1 Tax=Streptomyces sp. NBC_01190 TaxID=2903767 RepID=UPI003869718E|nr:cupin domain-containing protein [Streptomyces sp. NBC_01190]